MDRKNSWLALSRGACGILLAVCTLVQNVAQAAGGSWVADADGNWSTASNWSPAAVPGTAAGDVVALTNDISAPRTVTLDDTSRTVGTLLIGDPVSSYFGYTLAASGGAGLTFNNGGGAAYLVQTNNVSASDILSVPLTLADNLIVTNRATLTLSGVISGSGKELAKTGPGTLVLSGANTYGGATTVTGGGTLQLGATDTLPVTGTLTLGSTNEAGNAGNLTLVNFSQTLPGLLVASTNAAVTDVVTIGPGQTLTLNGTDGLFVGANSATNRACTTACRMEGGGALVVANASALVTVGKAQASQNGGYNNIASLNLAGLSSVTFGSGSTPVNEIRVGYHILNSGTLTLSNTNNLINATTMQIGHSKDNNGGSGTVILGAGTNVLAVNTFNIGCSKVTGTLKFASQTAGSPGTVTIGGRTRPTADFLIGAKTGTGTGATPVGNLDLRGHVATVAAGTVTIGKEDGSTTSGATGNLLFDAGTFSVTNLTMAAKSALSTGSATATLTVNGGLFTVTPNSTFTLASQVGKGSATATLNIGGSGTFRSYADIRTGPSNSISTINLDGGTLDMTGHAIGLTAETVSVFNAKSGTLMNLGEFNAGAPLVKTGSGTLTLDGTNTYTGATLITGGTLALGGAGLLGGGTYTADITNNAALVFNGSASQTLGGTVSGSGTLTQSGGGTLTLVRTNTYAGATAVTAGKLFGVTGGALINSDVSVSSGATLGVKILASEGRWSCKSLTLGSGTTTVEARFFGIAPSATTAPLQVEGNLVNNGTLKVTVSCADGASVAVGTYPLIGYTGALTVGTLGAVTLPNGGTGTLVNNTGNSTIDLSVTVVGTPLIWNGGSGDWDIGTTANWSGSRLYFERDAVIFDDTSSGTAPFTVSLPADVNPGSVVVDNPTKDYTLSGPGALSGEGGLIKRGSGTLTLSGNNTSSGGTTLDSASGTLNATMSTTQSGIGTGPVSIGSGSTLSLENSNTADATVSKANTISGAGLLKLNFAADPTARSTALTGLAGFAGTIQLASVSGTGDKWEVGNLSAPDAGVQIGSGNTLWVGGTTASFATISVTGTGNTEDRGAIRLGAGAATLAGAVTLMGDTTIASDTAGAALTGSITGTAGTGVTNELTLGTAASAAGCILGGAISDGGNGGRVALTQTKGTLTLSGANTYSGLTTVNGNSTLVLGATDALPVAGAVVLGITTNAGNLDLGAFSQTIGSLLAVSSSSSANNLISVAPGQALAISGSAGLFVGTDVGASSTTQVKVDGGGELVVANSSASVTVGKDQSDESGTGTGSLDLSGLSRVTLGSSATPLSEVRVAYGQMCSGTLKLSNTSNLLTVTTLQVGNSLARNAGAGTLILGAGDNSLTANTINIGVYKAAGTMKFASQTAGSPGTVTIGGRTRSNADFVIGSKLAMASSATPVGILDLRGHGASVTAGTVTIGREDNPGAGGFVGGATGSLLFDSGTFTVTNLIMAVKSGPNTGPGAKATATLTVGGGEFIVNDGPITFATQKDVGTANATLNLNGGIFRSHADILTGPSNCTSTINLNGGTLDMTSHAIGQGAQTVTVFNALSGTLMNLGAFNNGAPLLKTGSGTLTLDGTNTYAGATIVSNGVLRLTGGACLPPTAELYLSTGATCQLDYAGSLFIHALYIDGVRKKGTLYGASNLPAFFSGTGYLELPINGTLLRVR